MLSLDRTTFRETPESDRERELRAESAYLRRLVELYGSKAKRFEQELADVRRENSILRKRMAFAEPNEPAATGACTCPGPHPCVYRDEAKRWVGA